MPLAGPSPIRRANMHHRCAQRYARDGNLEKAIPHFGRALDYSRVGLISTNTRFGARGVGDELYDSQMLVSERLLEFLTRTTERPIILTGPDNKPISMTVDVESPRLVRVHAEYRHSDATCVISMMLLDSARMTQAELLALDPVFQDSKVSRHEEENAALLKEMKSTRETRSVCISHMSEVDTGYNRIDKTQGLLFSVLRYVLGWFSYYDVLSRSSLVFIPLPSNTSYKILLDYLAYYQANSFKEIDSAQYIMKTTMSDLLPL